MRLKRKKIIKFRSETTRKNIKYRIYKIKEKTWQKQKKELLRLIKEKTKKLRTREKIIIYYRTIEDCRELAKKIRCETYFHETKDKKEIYERFAERKEKKKEGEG